MVTPRLQPRRGVLLSLSVLLLSTFLVCASSSSSLQALLPETSSLRHSFRDVGATNSDGLLRSAKDVISPLPADELQYHGTTCLSFTFPGGVIVAVDSRASVGKYVGSRTTRKVFPISQHVVATMAGGAGDCTYWIRYCSRVAKIFEYRSGGTPLSVASIASMLALNLREWRQAKLSLGTMVAGWDVSLGRPSLFYVDQEGSCVGGKCFCVGSGANLAYSVLDEADLPSLDLSQAADLATWAIRHATKRDGYSGGYINVLHINATGVHHLRRTDSRGVSVA